MQWCASWRSRVEVFLMKVHFDITQHLDILHDPEPIIYTTCIKNLWNPEGILSRWFNACVPPLKGFFVYSKTWLQELISNIRNIFITTAIDVRKNHALESVHQFFIKDYQTWSLSVYCIRCPIRHSVFLNIHMSRILYKSSRKISCRPAFGTGVKVQRWYTF